MAVVRVQTTSGGNSGATTVSATWGAATTARNMLVAMVANRISAGAVTVTPPAGQGWNMVASSVNTNIQVQIWVAQDAPSQSGAQAWNLSASEKASLHLVEYSGAYAFKTVQDLTSVTSTGSSATAGSSSTTTSTNAGDVFVTIWANVSDTPTHSAPTNSFSIVNTATSSTGAAGTKHRSSFGERIPAATAQYYSQITLSVSAEWAAAHIALFPAPTNDPVMNAAVFKYHGNGAASRAINVGFQPDVILWFPDYSGSNAHHVVLSNYGSTNSISIDGPVWTTRFGGITATGFTIGSNPDILNNATIIYYGLALGLISGDENLALASYAGDGVDNRLIDAAFGFMPDFMFVSNLAGVESAWRTGDGGDNTTLAGGEVANVIQAPAFDGYEAGSDSRSNGAATTYYAFGLRKTRGTGVGDVRTGTYTGDGADDRNITVEVGFAPDFVLVYGNGQPAVAMATYPTGYSGRTTTFALALNGIQALQANGFQVGTDASVNASGQTYYYVALKATSVVIASSSHLLPLTGVGM